MTHKERATLPAAPSARLSGEDLTFWWLDSPMQPTTMAILMVLDRAPKHDRLRRAIERAILAVPRYLAGAEIVAAYPFAPVAMRSPVSVALCGYRNRLFIGLDSDESLMPDVEQFQAMIQTSFDELRRAAGVRAGRVGPTVWCSPRAESGGRARSSRAEQGGRK